MAHGHSRNYTTLTDATLAKAGQADQMPNQRIPDGHLLVNGLDLPGGHHLAADQVGRDFVTLEEGDPFDAGKRETCQNLLTILKTAAQTHLNRLAC